MLVFSRRPGQKVCFPELGVLIEVLQSNGVVAKLGITAPLNIKVHRAEVQEPNHAVVNDLSGAVNSGSEC